MATTPDIPEGLELRKDGTIVVHLDDDQGRNSRLQLRRPKIRELRQFRQDEWEMADQIAEFVKKGRAELDAFDLDQYGEDNPMPKEVIREVTDITRRVNRESALFAEDLRIPWAANVLSVLGGRDIDEDDLPAWCGTADFAAVTLNHWLTVPTRRGSP